MLLNECNNLHEETASFSGPSVLMLVFINAGILKFAFIYYENFYQALFVSLPLFLASLIYHRKPKPIILANLLSIKSKR